MKSNEKKFLKDLNKFFKKIKIKKDKIIVFQTDVIPTAIFYKLNGKFVSKTIFKQIEKNFDNKTILFPAFSNDFVKKKNYDIFLSKPYTGIIPNLALKSKNYQRTESPLHSFLIKGPQTKLVMSLKQKTTWGAGSVFNWLYENKARWISFNLELNRGCAIHHMSEEIAKVPYRFFKIFNGKIYANRKLLNRNFNEKKYSYYLKYYNKLNYNKWPKFMRKNIDYKKISISKGLFASFFLVNNIINRSVKYYKKYPFGSIDL
jgi:aminoglycoside N3'-acetyltransferase